MRCESGTSLFQRIWIAAGLVLVTALSAQQSTPDYAGYVFGIQGSWRAGTPFDLVMGQGISNGTEIRLNGSPTKSYIRVGLANGTIVDLDCVKAPGRCRERTLIRIEKPDDSISERFRQVWNRLTAPPQPALVLAVARGDGSPAASPEEFVAKLESGTPDLKGIPELGAEATLRPARGGDAIDLTILPAGEVHATGQLNPGLFLLRRSSDPERPPAALLLVSPDNYSQASTALTEAKRRSAAWLPDASHAFRVSFLEELSREFARGK
jgi:hypothetical protein